MILCESLSRHLSEETEENHEKTQNSTITRRCLIQGLGRHEAGVLLTEQLFSLKYLISFNVQYLIRKMYMVVHVHANKIQRGSRRIAPHILNLDTR